MSAPHSVSYVRILMICVAVCVILPFANCADWSSLGEKRCNDDSICEALQLKCLKAPNADYKICRKGTGDPEPPQDSNEPVTGDASPDTKDAGEPDVTTDATTDKAPDQASSDKREQTPEIKSEAMAEPVPEGPKEAPADVPPVQLMVTNPPPKRQPQHPCEATKNATHCSCVPSTFTRLVGSAHGNLVQHALALKDQSNNTITIDGSGTIKLWQYNSNAKSNPFTIANAHGGMPVYDAAVLDDWLVTLGADNNVQLRRFPKGATVSWSNSLKGTWKYSNGGVPLRVAIVRTDVDEASIIVGNSFGHLVYRTVELSTAKFLGAIRINKTEHQGNNIFAIAAHPTRPFFATAGQDTNKTGKQFKIAVWQMVKIGAGVLASGTHADPLDVPRSLVFHPDNGDVLLSGTGSGAIRGWRFFLPPNSVSWKLQLIGGSDLKPTVGKGNDVFGLVFGKGDIFASATPEGKIEVRLLTRNSEDQATGAKSLRSFTAHTGVIEALAYTQNGERLVSGGHDHNVRFWSANNKYVALTGFGKLNNAPIGSINAMALSPNQAFVAVGMNGGQVSTYALGTNQGKSELLGVLQGNGGSAEVKALSYNLNGRFLVAVSNRGSFVLWDLDRQNGGKFGEFAQTIDGGRNILHAVAFHPLYPGIFAIGDDRGKVQFWRATPPSSGVPLKVVKLGEFLNVSTGGARAKSIRSLAFDAAGIQLIVGDEEGAVKVWEWNRKLRLRQYQQVAGSLLGLAFMPDSTTQFFGTTGFDTVGVACRDDCRLYSWNVLSGARSDAHKVGDANTHHPSAIRGLVISPGGTWLATTSWTNGVSGSWKEALRFWRPGKVSGNQPLGATLIGQPLERPGQLAFLRDQFQSAAGGWGKLLIGTRDGKILEWTCKAP